MLDFLGGEIDFGMSDDEESDDDLDAESIIPSANKPHLSTSTVRAVYAIPEVDVANSSFSLRL